MCKCRKHTNPAEVMMLGIVHGLIPVLMHTQLKINGIIEVHVAIFKQGNHGGQLKSGAGFMTFTHSVVVILCVVSAGLKTEVRNGTNGPRLYIHEHTASVI